MNPLLSHLQPYPFERLRQLFAGVTPPAAFSPVSLGMGEPRHPTPQFIKDAISANLDGLASYPATAGDLRSIAMLLDYHYVRRGRYPASADFERWLESSFRPNQLKKLTLDHWGQAYIYRAGPDLRSFELLSRGPDGRLGSADDLRYVGP